MDERNFVQTLNNNSKTFQKAQRKTSRVIQRSTKSILKDAEKSDRLLRLQKRRALRTEENQSYMTPQKEEEKEIFLSSESHFLKKISQHPERDLQDFTRVIDQPDSSHKPDEDKSFAITGKKRLFSETTP